jgi:hypothetical protein
MYVYDKDCGCGYIEHDVDDCVVSMDVTAHLDDFLFFAPANGFCK